MKKILTALGNSTLNHELRKYEKYDVVLEDLFYQEAVLDFLLVNEVDVIILSSLLQGQATMIDFVKEVKKRQITSRIILIVDEIKEEEKNILISKGIFDILYDSTIEIIDIIEAIDREEPINLKLQLKKEDALKNYKVDEKEEKYITKIQRQEVITVFGTAGAGKSTIIANLAKTFAKQTKSKILLIDLDTLYGNLDEILKVLKVPENIEVLVDEDKKCGINYVADLILKNRFDTNVLEELVISCGELDFLSGNTSLHYCQNVLNTEIYTKLLEVAKQKYDFILIDTNSNIFLDSTKWALQNSNKILFVTENTGVCLKKTMQQMDVILNLWKIWKEKIKLILNRTQKDELIENVFEEICKIKVIGSIKEGKEEDNESYQCILETLEFIPKKTIFYYLEREKNKVLLQIKNKFPNKEVKNKEIECM